MEVFVRLRPRVTLRILDAVTSDNLAMVDVFHFWIWQLPQARKPHYWQGGRPVVGNAQQEFEANLGERHNPLLRYAIRAAHFAWVRCDQGSGHLVACTDFRGEATCFLTMCRRR